MGCYNLVTLLIGLCHLKFWGEGPIQTRLTMYIPHFIYICCKLIIVVVSGSLLLMIQKLFLNSSIVLFITCYLQCVCIMSFRSFFMFMIVLVSGIIVLPNCSLFLVFYIWLSNVMVNNFLILGGSYRTEIVNICCNSVYSFSVRLL